MGEHSYKWTAKSSIGGRVNAVQNFARVGNQKAFGFRHAFWRGDRDRDALNMGNGEGWWDSVAVHLMQRGKGGLGPVDRRQDNKRQLNLAWAGRDAAPGYPEELAV